MKKGMKVKIISDGTVLGTRVVNAETLEVIGTVQKIDWATDANFEGPRPSYILNFGTTRLDKETYDFIKANWPLTGDKEGMKVKIISDGDARHTKVINEENGEEIQRVSEVTWHANAQGLVECEIKTVMPPAELMADAKIYKVGYLELELNSLMKQRDDAMAEVKRLKDALAEVVKSWL